MSVARTGALPNAYKYFTVAVNGFEKKQLDGLVGHVSRTGTAAFHNVTQLVYIFNEVFDQIHYPMSTVDPRRFHRKRLINGADHPVEFSGPPDGGFLKGKLATFRIHVQYRYHATWQGNITWLECGATYAFDSFLQLMKVFDRILGEGGSGAASPSSFANEFELMEQMEAIFASAGYSGKDTLIVPGKPGACKGSAGELTFVVRLLFGGNATWQGTIRWKGGRAQESFRSFLELLMMIDEAAGRVIGGDEENERILRA